MIELCSICDLWTVIDLVHVDTQLGMTKISQSIASEKVTGHLSVAADFCDDIGGQIPGDVILDEKLSSGFNLLIQANHVTK